MLSCDNLKQADIDLWFQARQLRVSASGGAHGMKTLTKKTAELVAKDMMIDRKIGIPAIKCGKANGKEAKKLYASLYGYNLTDVGVIVSDNQPCLCASLHGVVRDEEGGIILKCVEVKCPITCKDLPIVD
ncbi:hypothetical protein QAD02_006813 [Eretmocerus hayati]|uniref:Uncharacterized protein n=1 Tax=Eretmocerus hayati TaxID=131215 RepID=A0ACC2N2A3_9HYME|nr:hypothetical protein QAD02_006813 [Eretmocerus hayati]